MDGLGIILACIIAASVGAGITFAVMRGNTVKRLEMLRVAVLRPAVEQDAALLGDR